MRLATHAPTAYNLQNWRFIAVHTPEAKARLRSVANDQPKISDAAVTFIIAGLPPKHDDVAARLRPAVEPAGRRRCARPMSIIPAGSGTKPSGRRLLPGRH
ncbi:nitroreductase family protein [Ensifer adhaerens]|uniref:nitroreductase family protein n=1 Tax=Ensifer adhaerens TaxID=106592 RepID=UPI0039C980C1